jgi:predicted MFS family arabinose efflux permease
MHEKADQHPGAGDIEDAMLDGDRPFVPGTAISALRHRTFRIVFIGAFLSNVGSWMQNAILIGYGYTLTHKASYVSLLVGAQLAPLLLSPIGGWIADLVDRRRLLIWVAVEQLVFSVLLAVITHSDDPSRVGIVLTVLAIGIGQALYAPAYSAVLPALVGPEDLGGAISLNSAAMNGSRVIGPAIGGVLLHQFGADVVFAGNAVTYLFVVGALMTVQLPPNPWAKGQRRRLWSELGVGVRVARADRVVGRCIVTIFTYSALALAFVGQLSVVAERNLGIKADSTGYGLLYATFGLGAVLGALSIGTVLAGRDKARLVRVGMLGYALVLIVFAFLRSAAPAFPVIAMLGFFYFAMITSLSTVLQERLDDSVRGRVMALWVMGFGGTVGFANLFIGPIIDATSVTTVLLFNAAVAIALYFYADVRIPEDAPPLVGLSTLND